MMRSIDAIYADIPKVSGCRLGCSDCCGPVPMLHEEADRVASPAPPERYMRDFITPVRACGTCFYKSASGCSIYSTRPFMCRLFGAVADEPRLQCPHGAIAKRPLTAARAAELCSEYMNRPEAA